MTVRIMLNENLDKAQASAGFAKNDLQQALKDAGPVESIIILQLIARAAELERDTRVLLGAIIDKRGD